jgi:hypothetical protein
MTKSLSYLIVFASQHLYIPFLRYALKTRSVIGSIRWLNVFIGTLERNKDNSMSSPICYTVLAMIRLIDNNTTVLIVELFLNLSSNFNFHYHSYLYITYNNFRKRIFFETLIKKLALLTHC